MADLRYGIVTFKGHRAGILQEQPGGGTLFIYDDDSPEIACGLPRQQDRYEWPEGVHPVFAHLAPEGWLRSRQSAVADADFEDDFGLLLAFGQDCIGALGIEDIEGAGAHIHLREQADAETVAIAESHRTISGVQAKLLCHKEGAKYIPSGQDDPANIIAKFAREDLVDLVANEVSSLELCQILLGEREVVKFRKGIVSKIGKPALLVERFDRIGTGFREKLRCEDFAQVQVRAPGRDRRNKYRVDYADLGDALRFSAAPLVDIQKVFARLVAFLLIGNTDCHLKNWSLLETPRGLRLSPTYDVINSYIYGAQGYSTAFGLRLDGAAVQWDQCGRAFLSKVTDRLGLPERAAEDALDKIGKKKTRFLGRLDKDLGLSDERSYQFRAAVIEKWETIYG